MFFVFLTLVTGPRKSLSLELSDKRVYEYQMRARLGTTAQMWLGVGAVSYLHTVDVEGFFGAKFRVLRDQICITQGPAVHCVEEFCLLLKGS